MPRVTLSRDLAIRLGAIRLAPGACPVRGPYVFITARDHSFLYWPLDRVLAIEVRR